MTSRQLALAGAALSLFYANAAFAFPEMVRKGYANCTSCHVSTTGGGVLTEYGRELSVEALSWKGSESEAEFAYDLFKSPEWLNAGGDVRWVQTYVNTPTSVSGRDIWMQADGEAAVTVGPFTADGTAGVDEFGSFISRRHYLIYRTPVEGLSLRAGKFLPEYGIHFADHYLEVRRGLNLNEEAFPNLAESYNLEAAYIGETWNFYATAIFGRPDDLALNHEKGFSLQASYFFDDRYKVGVSLYGGRHEDTSEDVGPGYRYVYGPYGILGFTKYFFLLSEFDFQTLQNSNEGFADYNRLDYEIFQGLHIFLTQEYGRYQFADPGTTDEVYGIGTQFFPRPHFELEAMYQKRRELGANYMVDYAFLMLHFYL
jgi:hypothetical protein